MKYTIIAVFALLAVVSASCPNQCSGHGRCGQTDKCSCFYRWEGADCSLRMCPHEHAWVDGSVAAPHSYAECANKGICNQETGECECFVGYEGVGCRRSSCPNDCSGHGTCEFINDLGTYASSNWDFGKIQGCKCDPWYEGDDCSLRMCPRGDDPLTIPSNSQGDSWQVTLTYNGTFTQGEINFAVVDLYGATWTTRQYDLATLITNNANGEARVQTLLEELQVIKSLTSVEQNNDVGSAGDWRSRNVTWDIVLANPARISDIFLEYRNCEDAGCIPLKVNAKADADDTPIISYSASVGRAADTLVETAVCGNRGVCDRETGKCQCFEGHFGLSCEKQTILV